MIDNRYGSFQCSCGETFQDLIPTDQVFNEETGQWEDAFIWDEHTSGERLWAHWDAVHA